MTPTTSSLSDSDDGEAERLRSVAIDSSTIARNASRAPKVRAQENHDDDGVASGGLKFYQCRARDLLHEYLDKTFATRFLEDEDDVKQDVSCNEAADGDIGFRLFRSAPPGLSFKHSSKEPVSRKRTRVHRGEGCDEKSDKFQSCLWAAAIDGATVKAGAEKARSRALSSWLAQEAAEKEARRIEEERVALLKQQRGEEWLPSIAREISMAKFQEEKVSVGIEDTVSQKSMKESRPNDPVKIQGNKFCDEISQPSKEHDLQKDKKKRKKKKKKKKRKQQQQ